MDKEIDLESIYEDPYRDRILFVATNVEQALPFFNVLIGKGYSTELIDLNGATGKELAVYDLVCLFLDSSDLVGDALITLKKNFIAPTIPCIIIHQGKFTDLSEEELPSVISIPSNTKISEFLVKVRLQLRLRKERFESVADQVSIVSENAALRSLTNQFALDMEEAREIHSRLLPRSLPQIPNAYLSALYLPLEAVGGDLYDIWDIDENHVGIFLADVTGHGLPAAFIGAMIKIILRTSPLSSPSGILTHLDKILSEYLPETRFATAISVIYDKKASRISVSRAGHAPMLIYRKNPKLVEILEPKGPPLTLGSYIPFEEVFCNLAEGDKLIIFTDGITEVMNMKGEYLGLERLSSKFCELASEVNISKVLLKLHEFQDLFSNGRMVKDDLTIVGLEQR